MKQLENVSPPKMKQVLPLVEQLPPLYMDLVNGRENFTPKPEETRRLVCQLLIGRSLICFHEYLSVPLIIMHMFLSLIVLIMLLKII